MKKERKQDSFKLYGEIGKNEIEQENKNMLIMVSTLEPCHVTTSLIQLPCYYDHFLCPKLIKSPLIFSSDNHVNPTTPLVEPNFHRPSVVVLMVFYCIYISQPCLIVEDLMRPKIFNILYLARFIED